VVNLSNLNGSQISGFSALLYVNFIIKKKYRVDAVAKEMQIATDTLYRYVRGENVIPPDRVVDLVRTTGDVEYLEFFCEPCGFLPVPAVKGKLGRHERERDQIYLSILNGEALKQIEMAYEDGKLDRVESKRIEKALTRLQAKAAELKEKIKGDAP
jgi:hypothetical protein